LSNIELLKELQETERNIQKIKQLYTDLQSSKELADKKDGLNRSKVFIEKKEEEIVTEKKKLRRMELKNETIDEELNEINSSLYGGEVSNTKELLQMEKKIKVLSGEKESLEELILSQMEKIEEHEKELEKEKLKEKEQKADLEKLVARIREESKKLKSDYDNLKEEAEKLKSQIPLEQLERYKRLKKSLGFKVVADVNNGICLGCQVSLSSSLVGKLYTPDIELNCENCGRILLLPKTEKKV